ncbi:hypothetical protein Ciccas_003581 [Cichlidogyrus casuarinus]|uniref:Uncharacterized protein n=1 Tax=Cichlidogyrus casuarinus TaxID=1844966 RepID=A0ABD2QDY2_9PLAT
MRLLSSHLNQKVKAETMAKEYVSERDFSTHYAECKLLYVRQTRRLQKYFRVTPEGRLLVHNPRKSGQSFTSTEIMPSALEKMRTDSLEKLSFSEEDKLSKLISGSRLERIKSAYQNACMKRSQLVPSESLPELKNLPAKSNGIYVHPVELDSCPEFLNKYLLDTNQAPDNPSDCPTPLALQQD